VSRSRGALAEIAAAGGGLVEAISEVTAGREAQGRFLFSATVELFEQYGFARFAPGSGNTRGSSVDASTPRSGAP
jgi:hypothetical protein